MNRSSSTYGKTSSNISSYGDPDHPSFTGKETDCETGFSYFGARYYDPTLLTGWTAVDPMSDKYPSLSPYNYCAWNPMKLVDPDGMDTFNINIAYMTDGSKSGNITCVKDNYGNPDVIRIYKGEVQIGNSYECSGRVSRNTVVDKGDYMTEELSFDNDADANAVFERIWRTNASDIEFDYYSFENGKGSLYTSGIYDRIFYKSNYIENQKPKFWKHLHPYNENLSISGVNDRPWDPSESDFIRAKYVLQVPSILYYPGGNLRIDLIVSYDSRYIGQGSSYSEKHKDKFVHRTTTKF